MNVCVLSVGRAASTNLFYTIGDLYNFGAKYCEPFSDNINNDIIRTDEVDFSGDVLLKQLVNDNVIPKDLRTTDETLNWILNNFNKIICLYRENINLQANSFAYHTQYNTYKNNWWHTPKIVDMSDVNFFMIEEFKFMCRENTILLKKFANENNFPLIKYEDLIENEGNNKTFRYLCDYINIDFNYDIIYKYFNKENKVSFKIINKIINKKTKII